MPSVATIIRRRRARKARQRSQRRRSAAWVLLSLVLPTLLALAPIMLAVVTAIWLYAQAASYFPHDLQVAAQFGAGRATQFYGRDGEIPIYTLSSPLAQGESWIELEALPPYLIDAALLAEDRDFLDQAAFDPVRTLLQIWRYMIGAPLDHDEGIAATLAQETLLPRARSSGLDEDLLRIALQGESLRRYTPLDLLEWRLNASYFGNDAFGIEAAARVYLGKDAETLNLAEAALLAAIIPSPRHNPFDDEPAARQRQTDLLYEMFGAGVISRDEFEAAATADIAIRREAKAPAPLAPEYIAFARRQAENILNDAGFDGDRLLAAGGLSIITTLDLDLQYQAECVIRAHQDLLRGGTGQVDALDGTACVAVAELSVPVVADRTSVPDAVTIVVLNAENGEILSMVGDATGHAQQPAVILQPIAYMEGFLRRLVTPASMVYDLPRVYPGPADGLIYTPANHDGQYRGPMILRDAMAAGLLPPAVQVADDSGIASIIRTAHRLGFDSLDENRLDLSVLERGGRVSVLDAGYAYAVLAAAGTMPGVPREPIAAGFRGRDPVAVSQIIDQTGRTLWRYDANDPGNRNEVVQPSLSYLVNDILADYEARERVFEREDQPLRSISAAAVIDGLSQDAHGSWTIGYTPQVVVAVHSARQDGATISLEHVERAASAPIWQAIMNYLTIREALPSSEWTTPADIEEFLICEISGMLPAATEHCPTRREIVPAGSPLFRDTYWQSFEINRLNGRLATALTPDNARREVVYFVPPESIMDWWIANEKPLPPSAYDSEDRREEARAVQLNTPSDYAYVGGLVDIEGAINEPGAERYLLQFGAGVNPQEWSEITSEAGVRSPLDFNVSWDTAGLQGVYALKVIVDFADGRSLSDSKQVTLDNLPPLVELRASNDRETLVYPEQTVVSLLVDARDNLTIDRVEFYEGGEMQATDRDWPYGFEYEIEDAGPLQFVVRAYDQVGNSAQASLTVSVVQP